MIDELESLLPAAFFEMSFDVPHFQKAPKVESLKRTSYLPNTSSFLNEEPFVKVGLFWNEKSLWFGVRVSTAFEESFYPEYRNGDSLELFIDTRNLKTAGTIHRFCHHFVIFPPGLKGIKSQEVTRFRSDDRHLLCDPELIDIKASFQKRSYDLEVLIDAEALHGYDPLEFKQLGFTYRMNRRGGEPAHLALSSYHSAIENHPALWAELNLVRET
jgi:hypothetical protein